MGKYKPKPLEAKTCLACDAIFEGTPAATRCPTCRGTGVMVPYEKQAKQVTQSGLKSATPRKPRVPVADLLKYEKTCQACTSVFHTHKSKAVRCNHCITSGRAIPKRTCLECRKPFNLLDDADVNCPSCAETLGIFQHERSPEQIAKELEEESLTIHQERLAEMLAWLTERERPPRGYPKMLKRDISQPLSILWVGLCAADGAASSFMFTTNVHGLSEEDKVTLLTSFYRLRCKGFHPAGIAKLCPKALLKQAAQKAIADLPEVTGYPDDVTDLAEWDRNARAASLGL
jgi:hypothetical protein